MSLDKVQSGQPMRIKAQTFNSILDATRAYQERQQSGGRSSTREYSDSNIVLVKNDSGVDANRFDVLGIDEPIILPAENLSEFENRVSFSCSTPTASVHEGKFVVLAEPIKAGKIGRAYAAGIAVAWVYMEYDGQVLTRVDIRDGQTKLYPSQNGSAVVLWYEPHTAGVWGDTRAIVRFGDSLATDIWVQIITTEANGGEYSNWQEVELLDDGEGGREWTAVADGLNGTNDGTLYEINGIENTPDNTIVQIFPNPTYDSESNLPAWLFCYTPNVKNIGFGVPITGEVDAPSTNPYIQLTVTDSAGTPILDENQQSQTIKVWRNATRQPLYTDFNASTIFTYVRFSQPEGDIGGCIFSRTEAFRTNEDWLPADGYSLQGDTENPPNSTDITGDPSNEDHVHVRGKMYISNGGEDRAWTPWFVLDPDQLVAESGKVYTDGDDTTPGFLDDEVIVAPAAGHNWITKTVTPGGENDNKLLLEHNDWDSANTTTVGNLLAIENAGDGVTIADTEPTEGTWFSFKEYEDEYDGKKHSKIRAKADTKYLAIKASDHKVKTNGEDSVPDYLDDEILVDPGGGATYWLTKTVLPGGVADNKLLIEHDEWDDARGSTVLEPIEINSVGGGVASSDEAPDEGYCWIKWDFLTMARDSAGHVKISDTGPLYSKWVAVPAGSNSGEMMYWDGTKWSLVAAGQEFSTLIVPAESSTPTFTRCNLLGGQWHYDTVAGTVEAGALVMGSSTPKWSKVSPPANRGLLSAKASIGGGQWISPAQSGKQVLTAEDGNMAFIDGVPVKEGTAANQMLKWTGSIWDLIAPPSSSNQVLGGTPGWTGDMQWVTVVTDVQYDATSHTLQKKTRSIRVVDVGTESGWTDFATAVEGCSN